MEPPEKVNKSLSRVGVTREQAVQLGKSREVTREQRAKGDASAGSILGRTELWDRSGRRFLTLGALN